MTSLDVTQRHTERLFVVVSRQLDCSHRLHARVRGAGIPWTDLSHTYIGDLEIVVIAPDGSSLVILTSPSDVYPSNFNGTYTMVVDPLLPTIDEAASPLGDDDDLPGGSYAISQYGGGDPGERTDYTALEGLALDGTWTLEVSDFGRFDSGLLGSWSLDVNTVPDEPWRVADVNGDGQVSVADVGILATNFGLTLAGGRSVGDVTVDGSVTVADVGILATYFGQPNAASSISFAAALAEYPALAAAVPEPVRLAMLLPTVLLLRRRHRSVPL